MEYLAGCNGFLMLITSEFASPRFFGGTEGGVFSGGSQNLARIADSSEGLGKLTARYFRVASAPQSCSVPRLVHRLLAHCESAAQTIPGLPETAFAVHGIPRWLQQVSYANHISVSLPPILRGDRGGSSLPRFFGGTEGGLASPRFFGGTEGGLASPRFFGGTEGGLIGIICQVTICQRMLGLQGSRGRANGHHHCESSAR